MWSYTRFGVAMTLLCLSTLFLSSCAALPAPASVVAQAAEAEPVADQNAKIACAVTEPFQDQPPNDPHADPFAFGNWHINADRTLWVYVPDSGVWHTGGVKAIWIRPAGTDLRISGQRLDGDAEPLVVEQPCCYPTGFQVNGLVFPTAGCWEVSARAGDHELRFIIEVQAAQPQTDAGQNMGIDPASPLSSSVLLQVCGAANCELRVHDVVSGSTLEQFAPIDLGHYAIYAPSHDLSQLALIEYHKPGMLQDGQLTFIELATWERITTTLTFDGAYNMPTFSPDNSRLLVVTQNEVYGATDVVYLVDIVAQEVLASHNLPFYPVRYQFTHDRSGIMFYGMEPDRAVSQVALLDAGTLELVWEARIEGLLNGHVMAENSTNPQDGVWWQPATAFATEQDILYVVHADVPKQTTIDFAAQRVTTRDISERMSWIEQLLWWSASTAHAKMVNGVTKQAALSPDGTQLYTIGIHSEVEDQSNYVQSGLGLQVIDLATAELVAKVETEAQSLTVDAQHNRLYLHGWLDDPSGAFVTEWTEVLDTTTLDEITRIDHKSVAVARRLDGTQLLLATTQVENGKSELSVLDPETFEAVGEPTVWNQGHVGWLVMP